MQISIQRDMIDNTKCTLIPDGKIDTTTAVEFGTFVNDAIEDYDIKDLTLDFSKVIYISSMGLRILLELQKKMKDIGEMKISNAQESVLEVFKITGFDKIINLK